MTLSDQLTVIPRPEWLRDDTLHQTILSARVGRSGTERHAVHTTVWAPIEEREHPLPGYPRIPAKPASVSAGNVHCGSQRGMSSVHSFSLTASVDCERCLARIGGWRRVTALPEDVITTDKRGTLVPREA